MNAHCQYLQENDALYSMLREKDESLMSERSDAAHWKARLTSTIEIAEKLKQSRDDFKQRLGAGGGQDRQPPKEIQEGKKETQARREE